MRKVIKSINRVAAEIGGWLVSVLMLLLIIDFVGRGLYRPILGINVVAVFALVTIVYLGIAYCEQTKNHVRVELLMSRLGPRWGRVLDIFSYSVAVLVIPLVLYAAGDDALRSFQIREAVPGSTPLLVYPVKFILVIGLVLYWIQLIFNLITLKRSSVKT